MNNKHVSCEIFQQLKCAVCFQMILNNVEKAQTIKSQYKAKLYRDMIPEFKCGHGW